MRSKVSSAPKPAVPTAKAAAFFDLDGTLIPGSANIPLSVAAFRRGWVHPRDLARDVWFGFSFLLKGASDDRAGAVRDRILRAVAGHKVEDVVGLGDDFIESVTESVTDEARALLAMQASAGRDRYVVSATSQEIVSMFAERIGIEGALGTRSQVVDGRYTGELAGPFCYGAGKVEAIEALAHERGYDLSACYAFSDSMSDLPMLERVGHPVVVNPDAEMRHLARERGWPIINISQRGWRRLFSRR
jgi:HAD superfamily hydrolase (TIGR01490 family)